MVSGGVSERVPGASLGLEETEDGLFLRALGLHLDPLRSVPAAFVSHVHAGIPSAQVYASPETVALMQALAPGGAPLETLGTVLEWGAALDVPIERAFGGGTARLTIARSGHVLGGAQLVVDHPGGRLVYTGDWSPDAIEGVGPGAVVACDELIVTSTFALPIFRFDPFVRTLSDIVEWCAGGLAGGLRPTVVAQTPGPAQSIARALMARGLAVTGDDAVLRACSAFEGLGFSIGPVGLASGHADDAVVIASAAARPSERTRGRSAIAYASGWALLDAAVDQKRADAAFALAGQADFDALVGLVEATGARRVHATRGEGRAFAGILRARGLDARALDLPSIDDRASS